MPDKTLTCRDCGTQFVFTEREQEFYAQKGFANEPGRCPDCRAARKAGRDGGQGGSYGSRSREMFPAVCSQCGKETQVPFQPRDDRPVYCSDCYRSMRGESSSYGGGSSYGSRGGGRNRF
jgi:CxxC-x17-CxxC domain-containing protein